MKGCWVLEAVTDNREILGSDPGVRVSIPRSINSSRDHL